MYRWDLLKTLLVIPRRQYIILILLICTDEFFWKCSYLFCGDSTYCSHYYYVELRYSENVLSYSEERVHTVHTITRYSWVFLKIFFVIPKRMYILLAFLLCTAELFLKMFLVIPRRQYILLTLLLCTDKSFR